MTTQEIYQAVSTGRLTVEQGAAILAANRAIGWPAVQALMVLSFALGAATQFVLLRWFP